VSVGLLGGLLGVLAVGIFGDGLSGQGWNGIGMETYQGVRGQGVTGFFPAPGLAPDWPGQINAQLVGLAAIGLLTIVVMGALFLILRVLWHLWQSIPQPEELGSVSGADRPNQDPLEPMSEAS
jgi:Amt family ammonium transporter